MIEVQQALSTELFHIGGTSIYVSTLILVFLIVLATLVVSRGIRHAVSGALKRREIAEGSISALTRLMHYVILFVGFGVAFHTAGFNLSALFAASAVLAIGLGFAMQNIAQSFVSGIILLGERVIKPGDVLRVEDRLVKVVRLGFRSTQVETRDGEHLIMPNSVLVQSTVTNYTLRDNISRTWIDVGVVYDSDMRVVFATLQETAAKFQPQAPNHPASVVLTRFGTSSVDFSVGVWFHDPWNVRKLRSDLSDAVWWALKANGITIAFPQLDVHLDRYSANGRSNVNALTALDSHDTQADEPATPTPGADAPL